MTSGLTADENANEVHGVTHVHSAGITGGRQVMR